MLNFTTTNVINTLGTFGVVEAPVGGPAEFLTSAADAESATRITKFRLNYGPEFNKKDSKGGIVAIYVNKASRAEFAKATINVSGLDPDQIYRIQVYIRISGSSASTYANDWVYKGKPLSLGEFEGGTSATDIVKLIKNHQLAMYGDDLIKVSATADGTKIIIEAKTQYQRFINQDNKLGVELQRYKKETDSDDISVYGAGRFVPVTDKVAGADRVVINCEGKEAFGDFAHLVKDLRLPTEANNRWYGIAAGDVMNGEPNDDRPNPNTYYTQITVVYERDRGLGNGDVLGGTATSRTVHVFYAADTPATGATGATEAGKPADGSVAKEFIDLLKLVTDVNPEYVEVPGSTH